jgi:hypothetical protein
LIGLPHPLFLLLQEGVLEEGVLEEGEEDGMFGTGYYRP